MSRMIAVLRAEGWGSLKRTAGSQALYTWRRAYLTHAVEVHCNETALSLERAAYVGGRCEALTIGPVVGPVYHYDIRSLYPHVCHVLALPAALRSTERLSVPALRATIASGAGAIAEVAIDTPEPAYPATGTRPTAYPVGRYNATLCGAELWDSLRLGRVGGVGRVATYHMNPCLRDYARALWDATCRARARQDTAIVQWLKRLAVSLPGKLGQRGWGWVDAPEVYPIGAWAMWAHHAGDGLVEKRRALAWHCQRSVDEDWANESVPAIAAYVCAAGRMRLLAGIRACGREEVHYYDTDSIICSEAGAARLDRAGLLGTGQWGQFRLVAVYDDAHFWGQKYYRVGDRFVRAGIPSGPAGPADSAAGHWAHSPLKQWLHWGERPRPERQWVEPVYRARVTWGVLDADGRVQPRIVEDW
jgi:hypothetical protein